MGLKANTKTERGGRVKRSFEVDVPPFVGAPSGTGENCQWVYIGWKSGGACVVALREVNIKPSVVPGQGETESAEVLMDL